MAVTLVGSSSPAKVVGGGVTLSWPAGHQAGDVAIIYIAMRSNGSTTPALPAPCATMLVVPDGSAGTTSGYLSGLRVCYMVASSSAESALSIASGTTYTIAAMSVFRGVDNASPVRTSVSGKVDAATADLAFSVAPDVSGLSGSATAIAIASWGRSAAATSVDFGTLEVNNGGTGTDSQGSLYSTIGSVTSASTDMPTLAGTYQTGSSNKVATAHVWVVLKADSVAAGSSAGTFTFSGTATGQVGSGPASTGMFAFSGSAALAGTGALAASITSIVSGSAVIGGTAQISSTGTFAFSGTASGGTGTLPSVTLTATFSGTAALTGMGALASSAGFAFGGSTAVTAIAPGISTGTFAFSGSATGLRIGKLASSGGLSVAGTAAIKSIPNPIYAETWQNKWLAVYVARQALLDKIASVAKTTLDSHASSITSLTASVAGKASVTAVETLEARVTATEAVYGVNLLRNAGLAVDDKGWLPLGLSWNQASDPNWTIGRDDLGSSYQVTGTHNFGMHNTGTPTAGQNYVAGFELVPVEAGYDYIFSAWLAAANVSVCDLWLYYYDAALAYIEEHNTPAVGGAYTGGTSISNWQRKYALSTPPTSAKWMRIGLRVYTSGAATPRAHIMQPMVERAASGQTMPSTYNTGPVTAWAKWDVSFNVDGYISGITLASDGRSTAFSVAADVFQVRAPSGSDALTWTGGVLSSRKGSKELKLGAGFGSDPSGKQMILSYGAPVADASASRATSDVWIAENGDTKFGGFQINYGSAWKSGAAITYSAAAGTPATATISVSAGTFAIGSRSYAYSASSAAVTGTNGTSVRYWLYYDDPGLLAGTCTLYATTDGSWTYSSDSRVLVGAVTVVFPTSGSGSGGGTTPGGGTGGGGSCVSVCAMIITRSGPQRAGDVLVGDELLLCDPETGVECFGTVTYSKRETVPCVRLHAGEAVLTCSTTAPIPTDIGYLPAPETLGRGVAVRSASGAHVARHVERIEGAGVIDVQHITVGDRCFWASDNADFFVLHHNLKSIPDL